MGASAVTASSILQPVQLFSSGKSELAEMEQRFIFQQRKSEDKMASFFSKQLDTFMNRMGRPSSSAAASTVDSVDLRLNEEHGNFEDESLLDDDQITPAQPQQILSYPNYDDDRDNESSDPGSVALNHSGSEDEFQPDAVQPDEGEYASDPEVMLDPVSSDSVLRAANFKEVLSDIIRRKGFKCVPDKPKPVMAGTADVGKVVSNLRLPPSEYLKYVDQTITEKLVDDQTRQQGQAGKKTWKAFPKPPKPKRWYLLQGEKFEEARSDASPLNPKWVDAMDVVDSAGLPAGHVTMSADESRKVEVAMRWQNRYLVYAEQFSGNVSDNLADVDELLKELPDGASKQSLTSKIELAKLAAAQTSDALKSMIFGNAYVSAQLEVNRRDTYLRSAHKYIKLETRKALRSSQIGKKFTFSAASLTQAISEIQEQKKLYPHWRVNESKVTADRLPSFNRGRGYSGGRNKARGQFRKQAYDSGVKQRQQQQQHQHQHQPSARGGRAAGNNRRRSGRNK